MNRFTVLESQNRLSTTTNLVLNAIMCARSQVFSSEGETEEEEEVLDVPELLGLANTLTNPNNRRWKSSPKTEL